MSTPPARGTGAPLPPLQGCIRTAVHRRRGGGTPPPPSRPFTRPPVPMFEADSQNFASVPRGFQLRNFRPAFGGDHRRTIGGGRVPPKPPPPPPPPAAARQGLQSPPRFINFPGALALLLAPIGIGRCARSTPQSAASFCACPCPASLPPCLPPAISHRGPAPVPDRQHGPPPAPHQLAGQGPAGTVRENPPDEVEGLPHAARRDLGLPRYPPPPKGKDNRKRMIAVVRSPCQENDPADAHPRAHKSVLQAPNPRMDSGCASGCTWSTIGGAPLPPPKDQSDRSGEDNIYRWGNLVKPFLVHKLLGPRPSLAKGQG